MEIQKAEKIANDLIDKHCPKYKFRWSKATKVFGRCNWIKMSISLSKPLTLLNEEAEVKDVILHEIAHGITKTGHNKKFYRMCRKLGARPERCYDSSKVIIPKRNGKLYLYQCPKCDKRITRVTRIGKNKTACGKCCNEYNNGEYSEEFIYKYICEVNN